MYLWFKTSMLKTLNNGMEALLKLFAENITNVLYEINTIK